MKRALALALGGVLVAGLVALTLVPTTTLEANEKPRIAVLEILNKADQQYWWRGGGAAAQDVFVTELVKTGKFRVVERERLEAIMNEKGLKLSGDLDASTAMKVGQLIGVKYFLAGSVTEYGRVDKGGGAFGVRVGKRKFVAAMNARIFDASTGDIVWADSARGEHKTTNVKVFGTGGGVDNQRMFDEVMTPVVKELVGKIKAANI